MPLKQWVGNRDEFDGTAEIVLDSGARMLLGVPGHDTASLTDEEFVSLFPQFILVDAGEGPVAQVRRQLYVDEDGNTYFKVSGQYFEQTLAADSSFLDARDFGAIGNGIADDWAALQSMLDAARDAAMALDGPVRCQLPPGVYRVTQTLVTYTGVEIHGSGPITTIVKLANGANCDILNSFDFASLTGGTSAGGIHHFAIRNIGFDGNRANNTSGNGVQVFGYNGVMEDIMIRSCRSIGLKSEWGNQTISGSTTSQLVTYLNRFQLHDCGSWGLAWHGPHDSYVSNGEVYRNAQVDANRGNVRCTGFGSATHFTGVHAWGATSGNVNGWAIESEAFLTDCVGEGGGGANCYISASGTRVVGGNWFTGSGTDLIGFAIDVGAANYLIITQTQGLDNGAIDFRSDGGNGSVILAHSGGAKVVKGTPHATTSIQVQAPASATYDAPAAVTFARGQRAAIKDNGQAGCLTGLNTGTGMAAANIVANRAIWVRWVAPRDMIVTKIAFGVATAATNNDSIDVGIASTAGVLLGSTGSTAGLVNSTGAKAPSLPASVAVKAGVTYYVGLAYGAIGGTAANLLGFNGATANATLFGSTVGLIESLRLDTAFPLATTTAFSGFATASAWPLFALRES